MPETPSLNLLEMSDDDLKTALLVELSTMETLKAVSIRKSKEYWKAVENRNKIQNEIQKRLRQNGNIEKAQSPVSG